VAQSLEKDDIPAISEDNILSTFQQLHQSKNEVFERGYQRLQKSELGLQKQQPVQVWKKIIINSLVKYDKWGYSLSWGWQRDRLADLERVLMLLNGKPIPDNRADVTCRLGDYIHENRNSTSYEDEMFSIKYFQKEQRISHLSGQSRLIS
jgi:hypothetical protein